MLKGKRKLITLGKEKGRPWRAETLSSEEMNHHTHIVGASGYGKSVLLSHIIKDKIKSGSGLLYIDLKGDMETILKYSKWAAESDRASDLQIFSLSDPKISLPYNLAAADTPTQLRDKILASLNWSEEYYRSQSASYLLKLFIGMFYFKGNDSYPNFRIDLGSILDLCTEPEELLKLIREVPHSEIKIRKALESCFQFLNSKEGEKSLQGLRSQLESLVLSDFGELVSSRSEGVDLFKSVQTQKLTFVFLDSRRYADSARAVGRFLLQDLKAVSAKVDAEIPKRERKPFAVIIDEFADLATEDFIGFLDRARSSKISVTVAHQEISDLKRISPEFANRLTGNTSTLYAFLQKNPESAEFVAGIAGTRTVWKETLQSESFFGINFQTGKKSLREVEEFHIHPNVIKSLKVGECVSVKKYPRARARVVRVDRET